jgi:integrase
MRRSEMLAMRWGDVDLEARTVLLRDTKNGRPRTVPLSPRALEIIRGYSACR